MNKLKFLSATIVSVMMLGSFAAIPVYARDGSDDTAQTSTTNMDTSVDSSTSPTVSNSEAAKANAERVSELEKKAMETAREDIKKQREAEKETRTEEQRTKTCQARQTALNKKITKLSDNATRHQGVFDALLTKVEAYKEKNNLNPTDWDALVQKAKDAKQTSTDSIAALKAVSVTIDCTKPGSVAEQVATIKAAAATVRSDLKAYRTAIKNVFKSLETESETSERTEKPSDTTTGTTTGGTN